MTTALIGAGATVDAPDAQGRTPLHSASWFGIEPVAPVLLFAGADLWAKDEAGRTPLEYALDTGKMLEEAEAERQRLLEETDELGG